MKEVLKKLEERIQNLNGIWKNSEYYYNVLLDETKIALYRDKILVSLKPMTVYDNRGIQVYHKAYFGDEIRINIMDGTFVLSPEPDSDRISPISLDVYKGLVESKKINSEEN